MIPRHCFGFSKAWVLCPSDLNKKKEEFASDSAKFVWLNNNMLICEPESEYDTAALLWILEGMGALPFRSEQEERGVRFRFSKIRLAKQQYVDLRTRE